MPKIILQTITQEIELEALDDNTVLIYFCYYDHKTRPVSKNFKLTKEEAIEFRDLLTKEINLLKD